MAVRRKNVTSTDLKDAISKGLFDMWQLIFPSFFYINKANKETKQAKAEISMTPTQKK